MDTSNAALKCDENGAMYPSVVALFYPGSCSRLGDKKALQSSNASQLS